MGRSKRATRDTGGYEVATVTAKRTVPVQPGARIRPLVPPIVAVKAYDPAVLPVNVVEANVSVAGAFKPVVLPAVAPVDVV